MSSPICFLVPALMASLGHAECNFSLASSSTVLADLFTLFAGELLLANLPPT